MSQTAKAQEPSMEEILASIRRIIADDEGGKTAKAPDPPAAPPPKPVPAPPPIVAVAPAPPPQPAPAPTPAATSRQDDVDAVMAGFDAVSGPTPPKPEPAKPEPSGGDVLDLTEAMAAPKPAPNFRTIDASSDVVFADRPHDPPPEPAARTVDEARRQFTQSAPDRALLSQATTSAVDNAFNSLAHTVLGNNARTLEDLVKEMLRPMLKAWLDDNLPGLVERIVRAEIERVSRGRG
jgi:cell pole-organizing protein PopZ